MLAAEHATAPQRCRASVTGLYLPREVFFGRLGFAGAFLPVCASDFSRFFPATSGSFPVDVLPLRHQRPRLPRPDAVRDDLVDDAIPIRLL